MTKLRQVRVFETQHDQHIGNGYICRGWFHGWYREGKRVGELEENSTQAMIERDSGKIILVHPGCIQFDYRPDREVTTGTEDEECTT